MATRKSKRDKGPMVTRFHLADNVRALRDKKYAHLPTETKRNNKLAKDSDCSPSQIQRIVAASVGPSVDIVERLAKALGTSPQNLITPYYATGRKRRAANLHSV